MKIILINLFIIQVIELVKGSTVYVNIFDVKTATELCKTRTELARALLRAVFAEEAVKKCTLTGQKSKVPGKDTKPGLIKKGVDAIFGLYKL